MVAKHEAMELEIQEPDLIEKAEAPGAEEGVFRSSTRDNCKICKVSAFSICPAIASGFQTVRHVHCGYLATCSR